VSLSDLAITPQIFHATASSQGLPLGAFDLDLVGFVLASREQVESPDFDGDVALFLDATGRDTRPFQYGLDRPQHRISVMHSQSRDKLMQVLPQVMMALSHACTATSPSTGVRCCSWQSAAPCSASSGGMRFRSWRRRD
jgi:hypothetical protein